jgi:hypothetical protein
MYSLMMEAARTSETSVDNYFTRQYIPEDNSELHTRRRENFEISQIRCTFALLSVHLATHFLTQFNSEQEAW